MMNVKPEDDTDILLNRAQDGDLSAANELFERHRPRLRKMLQIRMDKRLVARVDPSDVIQDTLAEASKRLEKFIEERPLPFYAWLRQIAAERLIQIHRFHLKTQRRSVDREFDAGPLGDESQNKLLEFIASRSGTPSEVLQRQERRRQMHDAVEKLAVLDREVLLLRYVEQLTAKEAAAVLGISANLFSQRHLRALKRLKSVLNDFRIESQEDE